MPAPKVEPLAPSPELVPQAMPLFSYQAASSVPSLLPPEPPPPPISTRLKLIWLA